MTAARAVRWSVSLLVVAAVAGAAIFVFASRHRGPDVPYWLIWHRMTDYELHSPVAHTHGCQTRAHLNAVGIGPLRRIGVVGPLGHLQKRSYVAGSDESSSAILPRGPGDPVFGARGFGRDNLDGSWMVLFVERSPICFVEYSSPGA